MQTISSIFTAEENAKMPKSRLFWFGLSLCFGIVYSILELQQAFASEYIVQEDARVYVFWMQRFLEPDILPNDLIAKYFESVTPWGFSTVYRLIAFLGINPLLLSKILPIFLKIPASYYWFKFSMQILPIPVTGFISTVLFVQNLSLRDDLVSATPRSFLFIFFPAFLYYMLRGAVIPCLMAIALLGLFYPPFLLIVSGILILRFSLSTLSHFTNRRNHLTISFTGLALSILIMLPYALNSSEFGPTITGSIAKELPALAAKTGRIPFFGNNFFAFWLENQHSGLLSNVFEHPLNIFGLFLPLVLLLKQRFPLTKKISSNIQVLTQIAIASIVIFFLAHLFIYKLFAPARYTRYTLKFIFIIAASIVLTAILDGIWRWIQHQLSHREIFCTGLIVLLISLLIHYPFFLKTFPYTLYVNGTPELYKFFEQQPQDIMIASLSLEADNIPTFAKRSILTGWEYAVPYHIGYYNQIRQRTTDLIRAEYSNNLAEVKNFVEKYRVDYFLLDKDTFTPNYLNTNPWFKQWKSIRQDTLLNLQQDTPILQSYLQSCTVLNIDKFLVMQAECVVKDNYRQQ